MKESYVNKIIVAGIVVLMIWAFVSSCASSKPKSTYCYGENFHPWPNKKFNK